MRAFLLGFCCLVIAVSVGLAEGDTGSWRHSIGDGVLDTHWGPDRFGYYAKNQAETGGPTAHWTDLSTTGTEVTGLQDDNTVGPFEIGFIFHYYWYDVSRFWVGSNGYIKFDSRGQLGQPFVRFPSSSVPNDVVAPFLADWLFSATATSECYYWSNNTDTLIVMWKNTEAFSTGGSHNFELILAGADSSITFQFGTQTGTVQNGNLAVGIENVSGRAGLQTLFGTYPTANSAIQFAYPDTLAYVDHDVSACGMQNELGGGFFVMAGDSIGPWAQLRNVGTETETACSLHYEIRQGATTVLAQFDTIVGPLAPIDTATITSAPLWATSDTGYYNIAGTARVAGDTNTTNDASRTKFKVMHVPGQLAYDDNTMERSYTWSSIDHGVAVEFVPPVYPVTISQTRMYFGTGGAAHEVVIYAGDAPDGGPGTELWRHTNTTTTANAWNSTPVPRDSIIIRDGSFFVAWWESVTGPAIGLDTTSANIFALRTWEYVGSWGQNRWWNQSNAMIRCTIDRYLAPPVEFARVLPVDSSTVPWMDAPVQFAWHPSQVGAGDTLSYHLSVGNTTTRHRFSVTDTTLLDTLSWLFTGNRTADVTWTVYAIGTRDSVAAGNGPGFFHLRVPNHPPQPFERTEPLDSSSHVWNETGITFSWSASSDPDGDAITYLIDIGTGTNALHFTRAGTSLTDRLESLFPTHAPWTVRVPWTLRATDGIDTVSASNGAGFIYLVSDESAEKPGDIVIREYALSAYPNPFNPATNLSFDVPKSSFVELSIYNLVGEVVGDLNPGYRTPGRYQVSWGAGTQSSGTYFAVMRAGGTVKIQKLLLMK
jgi:hypothetical protein